MVTYKALEGLIAATYSFWPFIEGVMEPTYTQEQLDNIDPPPIEFEGKTYSAYACTQQQRKLERTIRKVKREKIAAEAAGLKDDASVYGALLKRLEKKYTEFSKKAGLPEQRERMKVEYP